MDELALPGGGFMPPYKKRSDVEEYNKSLKQDASIGSSPAYMAGAQSIHIFLAVYAYSKLEMLKTQQNLIILH
jgi:hypothetical protein